MSRKKTKDITDSDIDALFNNNDTSVLKEPETKSNDIVPEELTKKNTKSISRPSNTDSEETKIKKITKEIANKIVDKIKNNIADVKKLDSYQQARIYIRSLDEYKNQERKKQVENKAITAGLTKTDLDPSTICKFHIYQPRHIMGDKIYAYCKFCSAYKEFSQSEWDDYCLKYRKWF